MQKEYTPERILSGAHLLSYVNPKLVMSYVHELKIDHWRAKVVTPDPSVIPGGEFTAVEHWFGAKYHVASVSPSLTTQLQAPELHPNLHLPAPNPYIPTDLNVIQTREMPALPLGPASLKSTPLTRIWHKQDITFGTPKANIYFRLYSPVAISTPGNFVQSKLLVHLVKDALEEEAYNVKLAGPSYSFKSDMDGMILKIHGYSEKANVLLERIASIIRMLAPGLDQFQRVKDRLKIHLKNTDLRRADVQASIL